MPLRRGVTTLTFESEIYRFCCRGCRQVFRVLMEASETSDPSGFKETPLFKKCQSLGIIPRSEADLDRGRQRPHSTPRDDPSFSEPGLVPSNTATEISPEVERLSLHLNVSGMWCPACAWVIEEALKKEPGVMEPNCQFSTDRFRCQYDPVLTSPEAIGSAIRQLGYDPENEAVEKQALLTRKAVIRLAVSAFLTMNIMMLSFALYSGYFTDLSPFDIRMISWPIFIMATVVLFYGGLQIHRRALAGLKSIAFGMEALISFGSLVAYLFSMYQFVRGSIHLYFDTAAMLITLVLLGKMLESRAKDRIVGDLDTFFSLRPKKIRLCTEKESRGRYVSADQIDMGDTFIIEADERAAADGIIVSGTALFDESSLTGESRPLKKQPGDRIHSGSRVISGQVKIRARQVGDQSLLGQMITIMEQTIQQRTPLENRTDRLLQWFVPGVIVLAILTGVGWYFADTAIETALIHAVTVLVISCPCALGIAIPLTRVAGVTMAAGQGILIRDFTAFERASKITHFVFDKTGTITQGQWEVIQTVTHGPHAEKDVLALAAGLEAQSDHYIALAIKRHARSQGIAPVEFEHSDIHENGVVGFLGKDEFKIGSFAFTQLQGQKNNHPSLLVDQKSPANQGSNGFTSRVYLTINKMNAAEFVFGDHLKKGARETISKLHHWGFGTSLISGDDDRVTQVVGQEIGVNQTNGNKLPTDKAEMIQQMKINGTVVAMVGDGVNDAPAMAKSDLALAVHGNHLLSKEAADVSLMQGKPEQVLQFIDLAGRVNRKIHQNFFGAFFYNIISIPIAISGMLTPLVAVSAMLLSSLSVIGNTLFLIKAKH